MTLKLHEHQRRAINSDKRIVCLVSGINGGKSTSGSAWMRIQIARFKDPDDVFLITAPDYKIMSQSTLPVFMKYFSTLGSYESKDDIFRLKNGLPIYMRSLKDSDSVQGIPNIRAVWCDEAGKYRKSAWETVESRTAFKQAQAFLTTNPYALNWLYKDIYKPWKSGARTDIEVVQFRSVDNPYFPKDEYLRQKSILDPRVFAMKFEGEFQKMAGLVFMEFGGDKNYSDAFQPNVNDYHIFAGVDFGYTNPFAIAVRAIRKSTGEDFQIAEFYKSFLTPNEKIEILKQYQRKYQIKTFYCDNEDPGLIAEINRAGIVAVACPKAPGSVKRQIEMHNQIIKLGRYKVFKGLCPHTEEEYETYHYPEDLGKEEQSDEAPVDANNHLMAANMYATACSRYLYDEIDKPFKAEKTHLQKLISGGFSRVKQSDDWYNA